MNVGKKYMQNATFDDGLILPCGTSGSLVRPGKLTWNPKTGDLEAIFPLQLGDFFRFHVNFPGCG